jgi:hypothetical protein
MIIPIIGGVLRQENDRTFIGSGKIENTGEIHGQIYIII